MHYEKFLEQLIEIFTLLLVITLTTLCKKKVSFWSSKILCYDMAPVDKLYAKMLDYMASF